MLDDSDRVVHSIQLLDIIWMLSAQGRKLCCGVLLLVAALGSCVPRQRSNHERRASKQWFFVVSSTRGSYASQTEGKLMDRFGAPLSDAGSIS